MKKAGIIFLTLFFTNLFLLAQDQELIFVKGGTSLLDQFTVLERYLYPGFMTGRIIFNHNAYSERKLNYNYLNGEIEFLQGSDTLSIANKKDIKLIIVKEDTFYYDKEYIQQIRSDYPKVGVREFIELKEIRKKDSYGVSSSGSSRISYNTLPSDGNSYRLRTSNDMVFKRTRVYYLSTSWSGFLLFTRKNVMLLYPGDKKRIKSYLKSNRIKFESEDDLFKLTDYLGTLEIKKSASS